MAQIQVNGINLYYEIRGKQEGSAAVVFLNGVMSSVRGWDLQVSAFEKAGFKILLHDFRGQLLSEKQEHDYTFPMHVKDLKALLDQLGIEKIHIISTSYGGVVGLHFTLDHPEYVKSLVLIDGLAETDGNFRWTIAKWQELSKEGDMLKLFRAIVPAIYSNFYLENNEEALREREQLLKSTPRDFMEAFSRLLTNALQNPNYPRELHKIKCPVFLACGDHDHITPIRFSHSIKEQISHAEFVIIPECGHTTIYEKPDLVSTLTLGFIIKNI